jgi:Protein of unknown function (DUF2851)
LHLATHFIPCFFKNIPFKWFFNFLFNPMLNYSTLVNNQNNYCFSSEEAAEKRNAYHILTERHLQAMWIEQKYFKNLKTHEGEQIEIISPGIWNSEAGPDFLKAHLKFGDREYRGDIEIHLSQEGWRQHNHHTDPNYDRVILHLCYWQPSKPDPALTSQGKAITTAYLQPCLTISEARIVKLIDLDLYPYKLFAGSGKCARTLFNYLPKDKTTNLFRSAALWRLKDKFERLKTRISPSQNLLIGGIAMALGYKHNAEAFISVFNELSSQGMQNERAIFAKALSLTHFFDPYFQKKWADSDYFQTLLKEQIPLRSISLKLHNIRPANHPVRRLAVLAKILSDPESAGLETKLFNLWSSQWKICGKKQFKEAFLALIPSYKDEYWEFHYTFEAVPQKKPIAWIGEDLKWEILINVFLPILYHRIENQGNDMEVLAFHDFYASLPASKTRKSKYLHYRFFGDSQQKLKLVRADLQQGAYQIHRDFCIHYEASCQGCPFVERYKNTFQTTALT